MATETESGEGHPVDPLSADEITQARAILEEERDIDERSRYIKIVLDEPSKDALSAYEDSGERPDRRAFIILRDRDNKTTYEATVSLDEGEVIDWEHVPGVQPSITITEFEECEETVKNNPEWREAAAKRGVENFDLVIVDPWSAGYHLIPDDVDQDRRLAHGMSWLRTSEEDNAYARPLDGLHVWVDLDEMEVVKLLDRGTKGLENLVDDLEDATYREEERDLRTDLKPYNVEQPDGPSWDIEGRKLEWQNWHIRVGFTQREGLVLHDIGYEEDGEVRPILNRASCVEMAVPYAEADPNHNWKNAFDVGEYNIGRLANSLTEGCDCLGYINYFDAVINDTDGYPTTIPNAICVHEEDYGTLWKHTDWRIENTEVRRNRRLVVSFVATVGNYDYEFNWYFYQDGSMEPQVRLTGINNNGKVTPGNEESGYYEMMAPHIKGMLHQHFFSFRLDVDIDGEENQLFRRQNEKVPKGPNKEIEWDGDADRPGLNPTGATFYSDKTQLETEQEAQELINSLKARYWQIENPNKTNELRENVGYRLVPGENVEAGAQQASSVMKRAAFIENHLWATPYHQDEKFPAGDYPNQHSGGAGLPEWTEQNRSLDCEDIVLWYSLGVNHVTRPEDWPVLPVHNASFKLEPVNFFDENPAMDVPPEHAIKDIEERRAEKYQDPEEVAKESTGDG